MKIILKPLGKIAGESNVMRTLSQHLHQVFGCAVEIKSGIDIPVSTYSVDRGQYNALLILGTLKTIGVPQQTKILGIMDVDAYIPDLNYVFGLADINGSVAVISLARLRREFNDMPADEHLFLARVIKEALHELGHVFGLYHCDNSSCVMHFSNGLHDTDIKQPVFCRSCRPRLMI